MVPLIGITLSFDQESRFCLSRYYTDAVIKAGGVPILIPHLLESRQLEKVMHQVDGLILSGGGDMDPSFFGEEPHVGLGEIDPDRDQSELELVRLSLALKKPLLAICRGCQVLNVALGGDLYQDLHSQKELLIKHQQEAPRSYPTHSIQVDEKSLLARILGKTTLRVNSFHHQAVRNPGKNLVSSAKALDGVIEAIESTEDSFVLGVQWHPECMVETDPFAKKLFLALVEACMKKSYA
ncbi:gamma-glutamyl-gamma-aminobutyrate hydrolase family protein [Thermoflavimicrobium dichotomicum]|uniref:Putative glutamine amidotransferase n=1 Tax=Thermoflavimicrobium dichotomicum TaxID=46223 RepID=A0A1I3NCQ3_9BACL|nr:gamma-glutamyl-gamma-aminobutyrate hydrolase family protein [Thermoflavimicrobium dichotomicum]SFJ06972.1 putative glutamine amidotransferase [Thermoflavimicrobium dichotomicum]